MGANLVAPVQQSNMLVTLALAIWILGEHLTPLRVARHRPGRARARRSPTTGRAARRRPKPRTRSRTLRRSKPKPAACSSRTMPRATCSRCCPRPATASARCWCGWRSKTRSSQASLAGGLISYTAAALAFALILLLPGQWRHVRALDRGAAKWFAVSGVCVCLAQMLRYMALALAPVSVVTPIQRLSLVFRLYFSRIINPDHEMFGGRIVAATRRVAARRAGALGQHGGRAGGAAAAGLGQDGAQLALAVTIPTRSPRRRGRAASAARRSPRPSPSAG